MFCVFFFEETSLTFEVSMFLRQLGGSGNCTNWDPAGLGSGLTARP